MTVRVDAHVHRRDPARRSQPFPALRFALRHPAVAAVVVGLAG